MQQAITQPNSEFLTSIEFITPVQATLWLEAQRGNRRVKRRLVELLKSELRAGTFYLTHQGIAFDENGILVDGQHRLLAIAESGIGALMLVTRGLLREIALRGVDQGSIRKRGDLFEMRGETQGAAKASICRALAVLLNPTLQYSGGSLGPTYDATMLERYRVSISYTLSGNSKKFSTRCLAPIVLLHASDANGGTAFFEGVSSGANLAKDDPRFALREWLLRSNGKMSSSAFGAIIMLRTAAAIDAFLGNAKTLQSKISYVRYASFCKQLDIPVNKSLFELAGGRLLP